MDGRQGGIRCAVLGSPIGHSLSPALHAAAYAHLGLDDWSYGAVDLTEQALPAFLEELGPEWRGLSLTMPLKRAVLPLLDTSDHWARVAWAANTVVLADGDRHGHNTDVPGAVAALRERTDAPLDRAIVLGGGATAASVLLALGELGCTRVTLLVRDPVRAARTLDVAAAVASAPRVEVRRLGEDPGPGDVVVSTIPADAQGASLVGQVANVPVVFEVVYDPWPTPLAASVGDDRVLVSGMDLLVHQAALQVRLMTGAEVPVEVLREAGEAALARRTAEPR